MSGTAAIVAGVVWTHGLAAILRGLGPEDAPLAAVPLTLAAVAASALGCALLPRRRAEAVAGIAALAAAVAIPLGLPGSSAAAAALAPVAVAATAGGRWLGSRLPGSVDTVPRFRPFVALAWVLLAAVAVVQIGRLSVAMTDREHGFTLTTQHPFWYQHECIGAYLYGAEMSSAGEPNLYHADHYLGLNPEATPDTALEGVALDDPYQYPPQFLLVPRLALALTDDVETLRVVWYATQLTLFAAVAAWLALWIGGRSGSVALWLLPAFMISFPALHNFQFGQFHLPAVAAAVAAMLCFSKGRRVAGGALLAAAVLTKVFPLVLLPLLAARRQLGELAWTAVWGLLITAVALSVLGTAPFVAFFDYHLPRMSSGAAFAFDEAWPELTELVVVDNQGVFGLARKLGLGKPIAGALSTAFGWLVLAVAAAVGLRRPHGPRLARAALWLALLGLASLASPGAWGDYVPVTAVWLSSLIAVPAARSPLGRAALTTAAVFQFFVLGTMPLASWAPIGLMIPLSAAGAVLLLGLFATVIAVRPSSMAEAAERGPRELRSEAGALARAV